MNAALGFRLSNKQAMLGVSIIAFMPYFAHIFSLDFYLGVYVYEFSRILGSI